MTPELAARRLSAALGRKVASDEIEFVHGSFVGLKSGDVLELYAGNAAYVGDGVWMKNGAVWADAWTEGATPRDAA
jgi:hypothetical protein